MQNQHWNLDWPQEECSCPIFANPYQRNVSKNITLCRVIPTLTYDFAIVSDTSSGSIHSMGWLKVKSAGNRLFSHEIWEFPVIFPLNQSIDTSYNLPTFYSGIYSPSFPASSVWHLFCYIFWHIFWHAIWHAFSLASSWHSILAFYPKSIYSNIF